MDATEPEDRSRTRGLSAMYSRNERRRFVVFMRTCRTVESSTGQRQGNVSSRYAKISCLPKTRVSRSGYSEWRWRDEQHRIFFVLSNLSLSFHRPTSGHLTIGYFTYSAVFVSVGSGLRVASDHSRRNRGRRRKCRHFEKRKLFFLRFTFQPSQKNFVYRMAWKYRLSTGGQLRKTNTAI